MILDRNGLTNVRAEPAAGQLTAHYDPRGKVVRLSEDNFKKERGTVCGETHLVAQLIGFGRG